MAILSIQSQVVVGRVGNSAAAFAMQRLGAEVWQVPTVLYSNHPGRGRFAGHAVAADMVRSLVQGVRDLGEAGRCRAVLSGYLGSAETGEATLETVALVKAANPQAIYLCDPVLGDVGKGLYVRQELAQLICDQLIPACDIATPNLFELGYLTGMPIADAAQVKAAVAALHARGPRMILVTSVEPDGAPEPAVDVLLSCEGMFHRVRTPRFDRPVSGAGDLVAGLFLVHLLNGLAPAKAMTATVSSVFGVVRRTVASDAPELQVVEAQDELVSPTRVFAVERVSQEAFARPEART
jgi:pyridoxine kinase